MGSDFRIQLAEIEMGRLLLRLLGQRRGYQEAEWGAGSLRSSSSFELGGSAAVGRVGLCLGGFLARRLVARLSGLVVETCLVILVCWSSRSHLRRLVCRSLWLRWDCSRLGGLSGISRGCSRL